jgi:hypothetical protein
MTNVASEFGAGPVRVPRRAVSAGSEAIARLLSVPSVLEWLHVGSHIGRDGYGEGQDATGQEAQTHCRRNVVGLRTNC